MKKFSQMSQLNDPNENTVSCDYYDLNGFNKVIVTKQNLAVLHRNISALSSHINELKQLLSSSNLNFDIICITESKITKSNFPTGNIHIPGYSIEQTAIESSAGGTWLYISQTLSCKNFIKGTAYKHPPMKSYSFYTSFSQPLQKTKK